MVSSRPLFSAGPGILSKHLLAAKFFVVAVMGLIVGYALTSSFAEDVARAEAMTLEEYVAEFDDYKADLRSSEMPTAGAVAVGLIMIIGFFSIYEALSIALAWAIAALGKSNDDGTHHGPRDERYTVRE